MSTPTFHNPLTPPVESASFAPQGVIRYINRQRPSPLHGSCSRFPRRYPFGSQLPLRISSRVNRPLSPHRTAQLMPPKSPIAAPFTFPGPILSFLDTTFKSYAERIHTELAHVRAACANVVLRHRQEREMWRTQCVTLKKERDVARKRVRAMIRERENMWNVDDEPSQVDRASERPYLKQGFSKRRAGTHFRNSTPAFLAPIFQSGLENKRVDVGNQLNIYLPPIVSFSSPPPARPMRSTSAGPVLFSSVSVSPCKEENEAGSILTPALPRRFSDGGFKEVINGSIPRSNSTILKPSPSICSSPVESDTFPSSSQEVGHPKSETPLDDHSTRRSVSAAMIHLDIMYTLRDGKFHCRVCLLLQSKLSPHLTSSETSFPLNAKWEELRNHCLKIHPQECDDVAGLRPEELFELRRRICCGVGS